MKKFVPVLSIVLFPYAVAFILYCIFSGFFMENVFQNNVFSCLLILVIIWIVALVCAIYTCATSLIRKWDFVELCRANMLIKSISIPAYIFIFIFGIACMLTIFTFAISIIIIVLDVMSIVLSGLVGMSAVKRSYDNKVISAREMLFYGLLQFIFCADVITSIILFHKVKEKRES